MTAPTKCQGGADSVTLTNARFGVVKVTGMFEPTILNPNVTDSARSNVHVPFPAEGKHPNSIETLNWAPWSTVTGTSEEVGGFGPEVV